MWSKQLENSIKFGYFINDKIVGCSGLLIEKATKISHTATLFGMYVKDDFRGSGIGFDLVNFVKDYAKKYSQGLNRIEFSYSDYKKTRGVEYQELFLFLDREFWDKINDGQQGLKTTDWQQIACLHTLFSRPKDGLVFFII